MTETKTPAKARHTVTPPAAPPTEPTDTELEQMIADAQAKLAERRAAEILKSRMADSKEYLNDITENLAGAAEGIEENDPEKLTVHLTNVIEAAMSAIKTVSPQAATVRTRNGQLRPLVKAYLDDHATESFKAGEIAKELDRSSGAVQNSLEALVRDGEAKVTSEPGQVKMYQVIVQAPATV